MSDNDKDKFNRGAVFTPGESIDSALDSIYDRTKQVAQGNVERTFVFPIPEFRAHIRPFYAGELLIFCGHSRNGKSFAAKCSSFASAELLRKSNALDRAVCIITWEEPVEVLAMAWLAKVSNVSITDMLRGNVTEQEFQSLDVTAIRLKQYPIYIIGASIKRGVDGKRRKPNLSMKGIENALNWIVNEQGIDLELLVGDHVHAARMGDGSRDRQVLAVLQWFIDLGIMGGCPAVLLGQAKQVRSEDKFPIPRIYDFEWANAAGYLADGFFGFWMPKTKYPVGQTLETFFGYHNVVVTPTLLFVGVSKQKQDVDSFVLATETQPGLLKWRMADCYYRHQMARDAGHKPPQQEIWY